MKQRDISGLQNIHIYMKQRVSYINVYLNRVTGKN